MGCRKLPTLLTKHLLGSEASLVLDSCKESFLMSEPPRQTLSALDVSKYRALGSLTSPSLQCYGDEHECIIPDTLAHSEQTSRMNVKAVPNTHSADNPLQSQCKSLANPSSKSALPFKGANNMKSTHEFRFTEVDLASEYDKMLLSSVQEAWVAAGFGGDCVDFLSASKDLKLTVLVRLPS